MKPRTKKTLIVIAALLVALAIVYFVRRGPKTTVEGIINRLNVSNDIKKAIKSHITQAVAEQDIDANAAANNMTYEQALALTAAYYLVKDGTITDAIWQEWKAQVLAM